MCFGYPVSRVFAAYHFGFKKAVMSVNKYSAVIFEDGPKPSSWPLTM